jgi:hypothetical protein
MYRTKHERTKDELESVLDRVGMSKLLFALAEVCGEKAEHLQVNWQDRNAAKEWTADAKAIEKLAAKIRTI